MEPYNFYEVKDDVAPVAKLFKGHDYKVNFLASNPVPIMVTGPKRNYCHNYFLDNDSYCWAGLGPKGI